MTAAMPPRAPALYRWACTSWALALTAALRASRATAAGAAGAGMVDLVRDGLRAGSRISTTFIAVFVGTFIGAAPGMVAHLRVGVALTHPWDGDTPPLLDTPTPTRHPLRMGPAEIPRTLKPKVTLGLHLQRWGTLCQGPAHAGPQNQL
jgi:hypothetical protein